MWLRIVLEFGLSIFGLSGRYLQANWNSVAQNVTLPTWNCHHCPRGQSTCFLPGKQKLENAPGGATAARFSFSNATVMQFRRFSKTAEITSTRISLLRSCIWIVLFSLSKRNLFESLQSKAGQLRLYNKGRKSAEIWKELRFKNR